MMKLRYTCRNTRLAVLLAVVTTMAACKKEKVYVEMKKAPLPSLIECIRSNFTLTNFYAALKKTGLDKMLEETNSMTVLAPDNEALKAIGIYTPADLDRLNTDSLEKALRGHFLPKAVYQNDIPRAIDNEYKALNGTTLYISKQLPPPLHTYVPPSLGHVNGAAFKYTDLKAKNGVVHIIDRPLKPTSPSVKAILDADTSFSFFVAALKKFGLYEQLNGDGPFTVFAPLNNAFRSQNISLDSIAKLDTLQLKKSLFSLYILNPNRVFFSDFMDALGVPPNDRSTYYFYDAASDCTLRLEIPDATYLHGQLRAIGPGKVAGSHVNYGGTDMRPIYFATPIYTSYDNPAINGVVHIINGLLVYPDDVKK